MTRTAISPTRTASRPPAGVSPPMRAMTRAASAHRLVRGAADWPLTLTCSVHSGQGTSWPARRSSTSNRAPQSQVIERGIGGVLVGQAFQPDVWLFRAFRWAGRSQAGKPDLLLLLVRLLASLV